MGNSATAVASIDSAPFRTLAGVASGTDVMKIDTSGNLTVLGNIVANGTV